jgi:hypothetical protein
MIKDDAYYLHQTPADLAREIVSKLPITNEDVLFEPFKGEGAFFNAFPEVNTKLWAEITEGVDYQSITEQFDWVITNPPFQLQLEHGKRVNSFFHLLDYYSQRAKKGIAFLGNDRCFSSLTPRRIELLKERGWFITNIIVCSIKKWRGRYFTIVLQKTPTNVFTALRTNY